jgi:hypothetical protein
MLSSYHYRSHTPEAVGLTGAGRAQRGMLARRRRIYGCLIYASGGQGDDLPAPTIRGVGRRQRKGSGAAGCVGSPELRPALLNPVNHPMSWSIKHRCTEGSLRANVCRSRTPEAVGLTGAGRAQRGMQGGMIPLARRRRIYGCLVSASGGQGDDLPAPTIRGVGRRQRKGSGAAGCVGSPELRPALLNPVNHPMSWSIKHRCTEGSLRANVCRSRTPESVGLTGAGRAQRGMQGESFPLPAGGVFRVPQ